MLETTFALKLMNFDNNFYRIDLVLYYSSVTHLFNAIATKVN